jgi:hypothetical protein
VLMSKLADGVREDKIMRQRESLFYTLFLMNSHQVSLVCLFDYQLMAD